MKETFKSFINEHIARTTDSLEIARLEIAREFFTNPDFRKKLEDWSFNMTYKPSK